VGNLNPKSTGVVFAVAFLLTVASTSMPALGGATTSPYLQPSKVSTYGPIVHDIQYTNYSGSDANAAADLAFGTSLQAYDASFTAAEWSSLLSSPSVATGKTDGFQFAGINFNMLRPIVNDTYFHKAIAYLWNSSQFESQVLGGLEGTSGPALFPCTLYSSACDNKANAPSYGTAMNLQLAYSLLIGIKSPSGYQYLVPYDGQGSIGSYAALAADYSYSGRTSSARWCVEGTAIPTACTASSAVGFAPGDRFQPIWFYRTNDYRNYFSDWISKDALKIGLTFSLAGNGGLGGAIDTVFYGSGGAVISDGTYKSTGKSCNTWGCKGYNTEPKYNYKTAAEGGSDSWDMYSYVYNYEGFFASMDMMMNSAYGSPAHSETNADNVHNATLDYATNAVIYATSAGAAASENRIVAADQLETLDYLNIYYVNVLYANFKNGWAGFAAIPSWGPNSGPGLGYTALNVHQSCYNSAATNNLATCPNGGTFKVGLGGSLDPDGGLNPLYHSSSRYDADVWQNIYDTPLTTPPTGFTAPLRFLNWMTSKYTVTRFTGNVPAGSFLFQQYGSGLSPPDKGTRIYKGDIYTFYFLPNIYWTDHVQMNALDYNFSLWQSDLVAQADLPSLSTTFSGLLGGSSGLMATYVPQNQPRPSTSSNPLEIQVYVNSTSVWDLADLQVPVMPMHIFEPYFSQDLFATSAKTLDTALNTTAALALDPINTTALPKIPAWLIALPNLEVGTGPFMLTYPRTSTEETNNTALLIANPNYYREDWQMYAWNSSNVIAENTPYTLSIPIYEWTVSTSACRTAVDNFCRVPMTTANTDTGITGAYEIVDSAGKGVTFGSLTCGQAGGICSAPMDTSHAGTFHVVINVQYSYLGLQRVWHQDFAFRVQK